MTYGQRILPYNILKTIWWTNVIIGILDPCDAKIYHIKCMWVSDLHFTVQWFCLISWRLFDGLILYCRYWFNVNKHWTETIYVGQWPIFHGPVILPYIIRTLWWTNVIIGSMWCKDLPHKMYVSQQPTFHGPVILSFILKNIWWINVVLEILIWCDTNIEPKLYM